MSVDRPLVLLVEDNSADANLVEEALAEAQLDCELVNMRDGSQALEFIERVESNPAERTPDLVLLDLNLPKVNGAAVLARVRSSARCGSTIVYIISSSDAPSDREQVMQLGASDYFRKPSSLDEFMALGPKVRAMLANRSARAVSPQS